MRFIRFILLFFSIPTICIISIDITLNEVIPSPVTLDVLQEFRENNTKRTLGFPGIVWIDQNELLYEQTPFFWSMDIYSKDEWKMLPFQEKFDTRFISSFQSIQNNFACIVYGNAFNPNAALYNSEFEIVSINWDDKNNYQKNPTVESPEYVNYWEYSLYGDYKIVPLPLVTDLSQLTRSTDVQNGISLYDTTTQELTKLPKEFPVLRNFGNYTMTALSFNRFNLAIVGMEIQKTEDSELENTSDIYICSIIYDGSTIAPTLLRSEPDGDALVISEIPTETTLVVKDAGNYQYDLNGQEDYWYLVEFGDLEGWVFGGSLLIEGGGWRERIDTRGQRKTLEEIITSINEEPNTTEGFEREESSQKSVLITSIEEESAIKPEASFKFDIRVIIFIGFVLGIAIMLLLVKIRSRK